MIHRLPAASRRPATADAPPGLPGGARVDRPAARPGPVAGFTLIEMLVVVVILGILAAIAVNVMGGTREKASLAAVQSSAREVYIAFEEFYVDNDGYPNATTDPAFQLDTFDPLVSGGYYSGGILPLLEGGRADDYDSPNDEGPNQEFWLIMTPDLEGDYRLVVANSDDVPLDPGTRYSGIQVFKDGRPLD